MTHDPRVEEELEALRRATRQASIRVMQAYERLMLAMEDDGGHVSFELSSEVQRAAADAQQASVNAVALYLAHRVPLTPSGGDR